MIKHVCSFLVAMSTFYMASGQHSRISISPEYATPLAKLAWMYKPSIGGHIGFSRVHDQNTVISTSDVSIGYTQLNPVADTLYYIVDKGGVQGVGMGIAVFSPFRMIQFKVGFGFEFPLGDKFTINTGISIGGSIGIRKMYYGTTFGAVDDESEIVTWATATPKFGVQYKLSDHISIVPFISYTFMIQAGSTDSDSMNYNPDTGMFFTYYSPGLSLNFDL